MSGDNDRRIADLLASLADVLTSRGLHRLEYQDDTVHIRLETPRPVSGRAQGRGPEPAREETSRPTAGEPTEEDTRVRSELVGIAYLSPGPSEPPFVTEGQQVARGDPLLIIEAMKVYNRVLAPRDGIVRKVLVDNGEPVEYGQALLLLEPCSDAS